MFPVLFMDGCYVVCRFWWIGWWNILTEISISSHGAPVLLQGALNNILPKRSETSAHKPGQQNESTPIIHHPIYYQANYTVLARIKLRALDLSHAHNTTLKYAMISMHYHMAFWLSVYGVVCSPLNHSAVGTFTLSVSTRVYLLNRRSPRYANWTYFSHE